MGIIKCQTIVNILEELAPKKIAESWDNVGLLVGDGSQPIKKVMVCLDAPEWVVEEAIENNVDMIVSHHPMFLSGLKKINTDSSAGRKIIKLIKNNISLYCCHTNYDITQGGLNDIFAKELGFLNLKIIEPMITEKLFKIVVFVPKGFEEKIMTAMSYAGAGYIGNYSGCTFRTEGIGTFKPEEGSQPFIGKHGELEEVEELRIETIIPEKLLNKVTKEMLKAHPYEEVAYDIIPLKNEGASLGLGRLGELQNPTTLSIYAESIKKLLSADHVRIAGNPGQIIKKAALLNGSGNKFVSAARFAGADVLVSGDMQYHEMVDALEMGLCIIDAGHFDTEKIMIKAIADFLRSRFSNLKFDIEVLEAKSNVNPTSTI